MSGAPDPKALPRRVDPLACRRKVLADPTCRNCGARASEGHHVLHRSLGGDDRPENIIPLCLRCHRSYHDGASLSVRLEPDELAYLARKLGPEAGPDYARRRLGWQSEPDLPPPPDLPAAPSYRE